MVPLMRYKAWGLLFALFISTGTAFAGYQVPRDADVLDSITEPARSTLPDRFRLLSWNVKKAEFGKAWAEDFKLLANRKDLVLLQEGMVDRFMPSVLKDSTDLGWLFATSWVETTNGAKTGIYTGSSSRHILKMFLRSPDREPFTNTPKMSLLTSYELENGSRLLVVNVHAINFVDVYTYERQLKDIYNHVRTYQGHILMAGDFNTWAPGRVVALKDMVKKLGMTQVVFPHDTRTTPFDYVFVKGCTYRDPILHSQVTTSDHPALAVTLECPASLRKAALK